MTLMSIIKPSNMINNIINELYSIFPIHEAYIIIINNNEFISSVVGNFKDEFLQLRNEMFKTWRAYDLDRSSYIPIEPSLLIRDMAKLLILIKNCIE